MMTRSMRSLLVLFLLTSASLAQMLTIEGKRTLTQEAASLAEQVWAHVRNQPMASPYDNLARTELVGLCENLNSLKAAFDGGVVNPSDKLARVGKSFQAVRDQHTNMPLDNLQREQLARLMQIGAQLVPVTQTAHTPPQVTPQTPPVISSSPVSSVPPPSGATPDWCQVVGGSGITVVEAQAPVALPSHMKSLSPTVRVVTTSQATPSQLRFQATAGVSSPGVELAFLSEGSQRWLIHDADYDPVSGQVTADVTHGSWWKVVALDTACTSQESAHFRAHYSSYSATAPQVAKLLQIMESARRHIQSLGMYCRDSKIDVYLLDLGDPSSDFGRQSLAYARSYLVLNLPSKLFTMTPDEVLAGAAHEILHDVQMTFYQRINTTARRTTMIQLGKKRYPYNWLNELTSSWVELDIAKSKNYPPAGGQLYSHAGDFHKRGLTSKIASDGYGGTAFLDFLTRHYGRALVANILARCHQQGPPFTVTGMGRDAKLIMNPRANGLQAIRHAIKDRTAKVRAKSIPLQKLWLDYSLELFKNPPTPLLDPRLDRRALMTVQGRPRVRTGQQLSLNHGMPPLALGPARALLIMPGKTPETLLNIAQTVSGAKTPVRTHVYLASDFGQKGSGNILGDDGRLVATLQGTASKSIVVKPKNAQQGTLVLLVPVTLDGTGWTSMKYKVSTEDFKGKKDEEDKPQETTGASARPLLRTIKPDKARINNVIGIYGSGFGPPPPNLPRKLTLIGGTAVVFATEIVGKPAEIPAYVTSWSDTYITVRVPSANYRYAPIGVRVYRNRAGSNTLPFKLQKK